jgi:hypothetical protein
VRLVRAARNQVIIGEAAMLPVRPGLLRSIVENRAIAKAWMATAMVSLANHSKRRVMVERGVFVGGDEAVCYARANPCITPERIAALW